MKQIFTLLILSSLFIMGCDSGSGHPNQTQENTMTAPFYIKAGISPDEYKQRNQVYPKKSVNKQPAGLNFYKQRWDIKQKGNVRVDNGNFSFNILNVLSLSGVEDIEYPNRGIDDFSVNSGITADEFIDHDQARVQFMKILQDIVAVGWHPYIEFYSQPRLSGQSSFKYAVKNDGYAPDPLYTPTLDEWMALNYGHGWVFHANDVFMEISFRRNSKFMEKDKPGVYLLTFTVLTRDARARNYFQGEEREQWQNLWVKSIRKDKIMRYQKEVELIKQGYHINTQYVEPKIHPQDPVEPDDDDDEAKALLDFIQKRNNFH